ncbi:hypothetical protein J4477_01640 [Candidatus Pacearchaeota archaeon]|nr:hypothetical protein [Candidatus Pacearchaeota archaeon]
MVESILSIIIGTIALIVLAKGFFIAVFPSQARNVFYYFAKNYLKFRKWGIADFIIGGVLLLIAILLKDSNIF